VVEFDETWAKEGVKPPDTEEDAAIEERRKGAPGERPARRSASAARPSGERMPGRRQAA